jgi:transcription antitermination factor NusG
VDDDIREIAFGTYNETALEPLSVVFVVLAAVLVFVLPRRQVILPIIAVASLIPYPQRIVIGLLNFDLMRVVLLCALMRLTMRQEWGGLRLNTLDKLFLAWSAVMFLVPVAVDFSHLKQATGFVLDNIVGYLILRCLVVDRDILKPIAKTFILLSIIVCAGMLVEHKLENNFFCVFGAARDVILRKGAIRGTAGFDHPILAGTYGAIILPLAWMLRRGNRQEKALWIVGMATSFLIVWASKSSGPLFSFISGAFAIALWPARKHVRTLRNMLWASLVFLQLVMAAPVWAIIFRVPDALGFVDGSTSYHRYELITLAVRNLGQWWLSGISMDEVAKWEWGIQDINNHYLMIGFSAGLLGLILFIALLVRSFGMVGRCVREPHKDMQMPRYAWLLGSLLFVHVMSFFGVSYFSGFWFFLNLTFALIAAQCCPVETGEAGEMAESLIADSSAVESSAAAPAALVRRVGAGVLPSQGAL